jgi:CubicO group peptidase (beta-lactamase class C family)
MANADMTGHWTARLRDVATREHVPGAVLGIWADGRETVAAHGVLSTATGVETTPDSLFQIGSITKLWTATMIVQLAEEGRLALDTPVAQVLPGVRLGDPDTSAEVTVAHLLTHTSGIDGDIFTDTGRGDECLERYAAGLASAPRIFPPGGAYSYCNSGYVLAGRVIEVLDGRTWDASLRERLTGPLGLGQTVTLPEEAIMHRAATGHRAHPHQGEPVRQWALPRSLGPAAGICSSARGVLAFARMHVDGGVTADGTRVLSQESVSGMRAPRAPMPGTGRRAGAIGLGWRLNSWDGRQVCGHDGDTIGQSAYLRADPQSRFAACLLTNSAETEGLFEQLFGEVLQDCAGIAMPGRPQPAAQPGHLDLGRHAGRYERTSRRFDVSARDGTLHVVERATGARTAFSEGPEEFDLHLADAGGDNFVARSRDADPWTPASFARLADQTPTCTSAAG